MYYLFWFGDEGIRCVYCYCMGLQSTAVFLVHAPLKMDTISIAAKDAQVSSGLSRSL